MYYLLITIFLFAVSASADFYESGLTTNTSARRLSTVSSSFTDISRYNSYDHSQNPFGILETEDATIKLNLGYRHLGWKDRSSPDSLSRKMNGFIIPDLYIGSPGKGFLMLNFGRSNISQNDALENISLPLNRFGFTVAGQTGGGILMLGLSGEGYYGRETTDRNRNERVSMGLKNVGVFIGSQVHELLRLGLWAHAKADFDSLKDNVNTIPDEDRYYSGQIVPRFGGDFDFGKEDFPVMSDFAIDIGRNHFVYVIKPDNPYNQQIAGNNGANGNKDAVVGDTLSWRWKTMVNLEIMPGKIQPAFHLGYWRLDNQRYFPTEDNDPNRYNGEKNGFNWRFSSFQFGIGAACKIKEWGSAWIEYSHAGLRLETGESIIIADSIPEKKGYNRFGLGLSSNIHELPPLSFPPTMGLYMRFGFVVKRENTALSSYRSEEFRLLNSVESNSQLHRYLPGDIMNLDQKISNVSFGVGASFLDRMFETDIHLGILRQTLYTGENESGAKNKGIEFGADIIYSLRKSSN